MTKGNIKSKKGFTIIEVVLVLAIAGLIFLMVFIALPALQRSQRDTQRRNDMSRFMSQLSSYQTNNSGKVPANQNAYTKFVTDYLTVGGDTFQDPSTGATYVIKGYQVCSTADCPTGANAKDVNSVSTQTEMGNIYVYTNATCDGEYPVYSKGDRKIAIRIKLEGAGVYCGHN